ncbi:MAG: tRNA uridine-5-carboxymethylaminomethyl(34) synthesis GTPase MnmE [Bdellovibrionales bacterium RIFOXYC1_FULL_54_43]|nr:MAG: tRNA uridine-5-carboxymethylaminomethyl(34) synthesis GTPase MnmE [Bdellovibrionales bacterium RIFOXYC1_FULL_54_43]OFZ83909.1 MAG: tRNA uridine-5-carboxymethylaminomethyl(34) synthesis GTPase MnmE [Bdellovibrionales bacterium RIFOXYD1_FULL_55_31]
MSPFSPNPGSYLSEDTIAALASAPGGAITILRISGPQAFSALRSLLGTSRGTAAQVAERVLFRAGLRDSKGLPLDEALAVRFQAPRSFTGEDIVELYLHGSTFIASRVMEVLADFGIRQALPGEFSFRAVRNGKLTLGQAQSVADLISATNDSAVRLALEKLSGSQNRLLKIIADDLRNVAVLAETAIDFSDQEDCSSSLMGLSLESLKKKVLPVLETLEKLQSSYARGLRIQEGVRAAFIGLPNAGKSSFFNALLGEDRSIVSELAGTTRDVVHEQMCLRGHRGTVTLRLEDTAGLRSSEHPVERMGIERTLRSARDADLIFLIVDGRACLTHGIDSVQDQWRAIGSPKEKTLGILSKIDRLSSAERDLARETCNSLEISTWIPVSSVTGEGVSIAIEKITLFCDRWFTHDTGEVILTRLDQERAVTLSIEHLRRAKTADHADLFAADIHQSLRALAPMIGDTLPDDILNEIFSTFCIGK